MKSGSLKKSIWQKSFILLVLFAFTMNLFSQQTATDDKVYDMVAHLPYFVSSDVRVKRGRGVYPSLDREAVRVISTFPKWHPGKNEEGESVQTRYALPVRFL